MPKYTLCPRCELNYILEGQEYCDVCKAELKIGPQLMFSVDGDVKEQILCPVCKQRYIDADDDMCAKCHEEAEYNRNKESDFEDGDEWRRFLDDDEKEIIASKGDEEEMVSLSQIEEEESLDDDLYEDEDIDPYTNEKVKKHVDDDDFDYVTVNEEDFLDDEDFEEDEDEE